MRIHLSIVLVAVSGALCPNPGLGAPGVDTRAVERIWKSGDTLPAEIAARFPNPPLHVPNDTGINVLVDLAHQCAFATMWGLPDKLHPLGFRSIVSHAALDTVLTPGKPSRMRVPLGHAADKKAIRAFGWVPNPQFNVVVTYQSDPDAQLYLPEERAALEAFVKKGGGLVIIDNGLAAAGKGRLQTWAGQSLATTFGADFKRCLAGQAVVTQNKPGQTLMYRQTNRIR